MTPIEVSFSAFFTIFVHFWPILAQYFDLFCTKVMSWAFFGTKVTPLAILHTPQSCLVALNGLKRAKKWLKSRFHNKFSAFFTIFINFWLNLAQYFNVIYIKFSFGHFLVPAGCLKSSYIFPKAAWLPFKQLKSSLCAFFRTKQTYPAIPMCF